MSAVRAVFDRANRQMAMCRELISQLHPIVLPPFRPGTTEDERTEWLRHVITTHKLADIKVRPSRSETWAQAFERVCGEGLE